MKLSEKEFRSTLETSISVVKDLGGKEGEMAIKMLGAANRAVEANDMPNVFLGYTTMFFLLTNIISKKQDEINELRGTGNSN